MRHEPSRTIRVKGGGGANPRHVVHCHTKMSERVVGSHRVTFGYGPHPKKIRSRMRVKTWRGPGGHCIPPRP